MKKVSFYIPKAATANSNQMLCTPINNTKQTVSMLEAIRKEVLALLSDTSLSVHEILNAFTLQEKDIQAVVFCIDEVKEHIVHTPPMVDVDYTCTDIPDHLRPSSYYYQSTFAAEEARTAMELKHQYELLTTKWVRRARSLARQRSSRVRPLSCK
jgi:hypothetical protein